MIMSYADLIQDTRIHGDLYRDPDIFQHEIEAIWNKVWVYLGHDSEIPEPGDYVRRQIGTQPVIMVRGTDGIVRVFFNRCRHRANLLCHVERGRATRFVCAYHAWTYKNTGELVAPSFRSGLGPDFDRREFSLTEVARVDRYRGLIFASLARDGISLDAHLDGIREFIDLVHDLSPVGDIVLNGGTQKVRYRGNWKFLPENTMEGDHHGHFIHKIAFRLFSQRLGFDIGAQTESEIPDVIRSFPGGHMVEDYRAIPMTPPPGRKPSEARLAYAAAMEKAHGKEKAWSLMTTLAPLFYVFPNLLFAVTQFRRIEPVSVNQTNTYYTPALLKGVPDEINENRLREHEWAAGAAGMVTPDDIEIMERNQVAMEATGNDWLYIGRGRHREKVAADGATSGLTMDENHLRGFWRHYLRVMDADHARP
jgi:phenylpropionate dioxygenase-like ring-hydroxylating dioxygenase large terminal subunit